MDPHAYRREMRRVDNVPLDVRKIATGVRLRPGASSFSSVDLYTSLLALKRELAERSHADPTILAPLVVQSTLPTVDAHMRPLYVEALLALLQQKSASNAA